MGSTSSHCTSSSSSSLLRPAFACAADLCCLAGCVDRFSLKVCGGDGCRSGVWDLDRLGRRLTGSGRRCCGWCLVVVEAALGSPAWLPAPPGFTPPPLPTSSAPAPAPASAPPSAGAAPVASLPLVASWAASAAVASCGRDMSGADEARSAGAAASPSPAGMRAGVNIASSRLRGELLTVDGVTLLALSGWAWGRSNVSPQPVPLHGTAHTHNRDAPRCVDATCRA